jgi:alpha-beta hydrolase superfamily lysophospholipase
MRSEHPETFRFMSGDGLAIQAYRWPSAETVRGAVQITHGMGEHALRYGELAHALTDHGFDVYAQDLRGHGATAATASALGQLGGEGWTSLVDDIGVFGELIRSSLPGIPLVLIGHSMGSFAVQQFLLDASNTVDAAVLSGTSMLSLFEGTLDLTAPLDLGAFNVGFEPARTDFDWLSRDDAQVDAYVADPRCGFSLDPAAVAAMFAGARSVGDPGRLRAVRPDLPLYIAVGEDDPGNAQLALVQPLVAAYRAAGLSNVTLRTYPGARHEIFNELNRDEVFADLVAWLDNVV